MRYVDGKPHSIDTVVLSTQHAPEISLRTKTARRGGDRGDHQAGAAEGAGSTATPSTWSTRPAASSSAARTATAA
ncbi:MAG: hypothetical protein MZW92_48845 [Comamonadaceae bacterium]|nr:hypothetical protein [Comamonadaceae bacterium]